MILELVEKHKPLAKDKPHLLSAWLSMMAFDDISVFAESTDILPEQLIQSLMYRLRDFQSYLHNTDPKHTEQNLEVGGTQMAVSKNKLLIYTSAKCFINAFYFAGH